MPVNMSPGGTTPLIDSNNSTFFTTEQTAADTQMTQTMPSTLIVNGLCHVLFDVRRFQGLELPSPPVRDYIIYTLLIF